MLNAVVFQLIVLNDVVFQLVVLNDVVFQLVACLDNHSVILFAHYFPECNAPFH